MQSVLSRNWTRIAVSISCDDNYVMDTFVFVLNVERMCLSIYTKWLICVSCSFLLRKIFFSLCNFFTQTSGSVFLHLKSTGLSYVSIRILNDWADDLHSVSYLKLPWSLSDLWRQLKGLQLLPTSFSHFYFILIHSHLFYHT